LFSATSIRFDQKFVSEDMPHTHRVVREISHETGIQLRCYEIIIMSLVAAFIGTQYNMQ